MLSGAYRKKAKRDKGSYVIRKFIKFQKVGQIIVTLQHCTVDGLFEETPRVGHTSKAEQRNLWPEMDDMEMYHCLRKHGAHSEW